MDAAALPIDVRARLDAWLEDSANIGSLVEYVAEKLGADDGEHWLRFKLTGGHLRETGIDHTRIGEGELRSLVRLSR